MGRAMMLAAGLLLVGIGFGQEPGVVESGVEVNAESERTTLDRERGVLRSSVDVLLRNTGLRVVESPVVAVVRFDPVGGGGLEGISVEGALGGIGEGEFGAFYFELDDVVGEDGLLPGEEVQLALRFERPRTVSVRYRIELRGVVNRDPEVDGGGPYVAEVGVPISFDGSGSTDPDGDEIGFEWDFGDGAGAAEAEASHAYGEAGVYEAKLVVGDGRGGLASVVVPVVVTPSGTFGVGRSRTLDGSGVPLGGVMVEETGPGGERMIETVAGGFVSLGGVPGDYRWKFSAPGRLPVWRFATLEENRVAVVPHPRLKEKAGEGAGVSLLAPTTVESIGGQVRLEFPAGAFAQEGAVFVTELDGQTLPLALPNGWSPLAAFHLSAAQEFGAAASVSLVLSDVVSTSEPAALVRHDEGEGTWVIEVIENGSGSELLGTALGAAGTWAVVVPDAGSTGPVAVGIGEALGAGAATVDGADKAEGTVDPALSAASTIAAEVTAMATVRYSAPGAQASGDWFPTRVRERYEFVDGADIQAPEYDATFFGYQRPGDDDDTTLHAVFPVRPQFLIGAEELSVATIEVDLGKREALMGGVVSGDGGVLAAGGIRVVAPAGALSGFAAGELRALPVEAFVGLLGGLVGEVAFELNLAEVGDGFELDLDVDGVFGEGETFVLGKVVTLGAGRAGLQPVVRYRANGSGALESQEPGVGARLPGLMDAGRYVLVRVPGEQALVQGKVVDASGGAVPGAVVRAAGRPWVVLAGPGGSYHLVAGLGGFEMSASDGETGDRGAASDEVSDAGLAIDLDIEIGPVGPSVIAVRPADGADRVAVVTSVVVEFSEAIRAGSFGATGLALREKVSGEAVSAGLSLNLAGTEASLFPTKPLRAGTEYEVLVSEAIEDTTGLAFSGESIFEFRTVEAQERGAGGELVIYEPGAVNIPQDVLDELVAFTPGDNLSAVVCHGSAGTADAGAAVILVNQNLGTTSTVVSNPDGSFASFIEADELDFIEAVFVNSNGTRITVPATKQLFDNGTVGLYRYGGILEAESDGGPVQVLVEPGSIQERSKFRVEPLPLATLLNLLDGIEPGGGSAKVLGGLNFEIEGDSIEGGADIVFPITEEELEVPAGVAPEDLVFALTRFREIDGVKVFEIVDKMEYDEGKLATASPPFAGAGSSGDFSSGPMALLKLANGGKAVVTGRVYSTDDIQNPTDQTSQPVPGAAVTIVADVTKVVSGKQLTAGTVVALAGDDGSFAYLADADNLSPVGNAWAFIATSPLFPGKFGTGSAALTPDVLIAAAQGNVYFDRTTASGLFAIEDWRPEIVTGFSPPQPTRDQPVRFEILVIDDRDQPTITSAELLGAEALDGGGPVDVTNDTSFQLEEEEGGSTTYRQVYVMSGTRDMRMTVEVKAVDGSGNEETVAVPVVIRGAPVPFNLTTPVANTGDTVGPTVINTFPPSLGLTPIGEISRFRDIRLVFNEPVQAPLDPSFAFEVSPAATINGCTISEDKTVITLRFADLKPDTEYALTVTSSLMDINGQPHDQNQYLIGQQNYGMGFRTQPSGTFDAQAVESGGGVVGTEEKLFLLDRNIPVIGSGIRVYIPSPSTGAYVLANTRKLPAQPRDLLYIEKYSFKLANGNVVEADLLVVVGGKVGTGGGGQWIHIYDVTAPATPLRVAESIITNNPSAAVVKLDWSPPTLGYLEITAGADAVGYINLQLLIYSNGLSSQQFDAEPAGGSRGRDLNGDGDYVDTGELLPRPNGKSVRSGIINGGLVDAFTLLDRGIPSRITDFDMQFGGLYLGVVSPEIFKDGQSVAEPAYWTLTNGGVRTSGDQGKMDLTGRPKRLLTVLGLPVDSGFGVTIRNVALVSGTALGSLMLIDITDPVNPEELGTVELPQDYGLLQSAQVIDNGLLALATTKNIVLLNPKRLLSGYKGGMHESVIGVLGGAGSGARSFVARSDGFFAVNLGGRSAIAEVEGFGGTIFAEQDNSAKAIDRNSATEQVAAESVQVTLLQFLGVTALQPATPLGLEPDKERVSENGLLQIAPPQDENILFKVGLDPPDQSPPDDTPAWTYEGADQKVGVQVQYPVAKFSGSQSPFLLAGLEPEKHEVVTGDETVTVEVYPAVKHSVSLNLSKLHAMAHDVGIEVTDVVGTVATGPVSPIEGAFEIKGPSSAESILTFTQQWLECGSNNRVNYSNTLTASLNPIIKASGKLQFNVILPPPWHLFLEPNVFIEGSGSAALNGTVGIDGCGIPSGAVTLTGQFELALGAGVNALAIGDSALVGVTIKTSTAVSVIGTIKVIPKNQIDPTKKGVIGDFKVTWGGVKVTVAVVGLYGVFGAQEEWVAIPPNPNPLILYKKSNVKIMEFE